MVEGNSERILHVFEAAPGRWFPERERFHGKLTSSGSLNHQDCVRRRAILSVQQHPDCAGDAARAEKAVNEVWESCKADTRPFDEIY